jgi:hypothetical protein
VNAEQRSSQAPGKTTADSVFFTEFPGGFPLVQQEGGEITGCIFNGKRREVKLEIPAKYAKRAAQIEFSTAPLRVIRTELNHSAAKS